MTEEWRALLYPLGVLPLIFFLGRFLIQWLVSEWKGVSVVPRTFWQFSLIGHLLMLLHSFIQLQLHVCLAQGCNAVIAWRNLNLMEDLKRRLSTRMTILFLLLTVTFIFLFFVYQGEWFRAPRMPWSYEVPHLTWGWHLFGTLGIALFSTRFWVQWWQAEHSQTSGLGKAFWWISLNGNFMMLIYFFMLQDPINCLGPIFNIVPCMRNLVLLKREARIP